MHQGETMTLLEQLQATLDKPTRTKEPTQIEKLLTTTELTDAIKSLDKSGTSCKKITTALNTVYRDKLKPIRKESRSEATAKGDIVDTRVTSTGAKRYIYEVKPRFTEKQICQVLHKKHPLSS